MPHRKTVRHFHEPGHLHELTFSCYQRLPLLTDDDGCRRLARAIDAANAELEFQLLAFVFMPEHVHLLVLPLSPAASLSRYLARLKQPFSKETKQLLEARGDPWLSRLTVQERPGKTCFRFWQEGTGFDRNLFGRRAILASIDYIHANPVRRGLCERAVDWRWSSARMHLLEPPMQPEAGLPLVHKIPREVLN